MNPILLTCVNESLSCEYMSRTMVKGLVGECAMRYDISPILGRQQSDNFTISCIITYHPYFKAVKHNHVMYFQWLIRAEVRCLHAASAFNNGIIWCPTEAANLVFWVVQHMIYLCSDGRRWFQLVIKWSFLISWGRLCILNKHDQKHGYSKPSAIWNYIMMYSITRAHGSAPKMPMTTSHWKKGQMEHVLHVMHHPPECNKYCRCRFKRSLDRSHKLQ